MPDFKMEQNFPMAAVIQATQRKGELDNEQTMKQAQLFNESLTAIGGIAQSLHAQKQKVAQALALGKLTGVDPELARTMDPSQVIEAAKLKKGYEDQGAFMDIMRKAYNLPKPAADPSVPQAQPASFPGASPSPAHQTGAILASQVSASPIQAPAMGGGGLPPPTTGSIPVPIQAPPAQAAASVDPASPSSPKMISPAVQKMIMRMAEQQRPERVLTQEEALKEGTVARGTRILSPKNGSDIEDPKYQQKLEHQYQDMKLKAVSNRSGGLGLEDQKVNNGIHLRTAVNSMYDPKTGTYIIPPSMHTELALGLARMMSPTGNLALELVKDLRQKTAREGLGGALIYLGFDPSEIGGTTQSVSNFFVHQLDRQAQTAEQNRSGYMDYLHGQAPIDLKPETLAKHDKVGLNSYSDLLSKSPDHANEVDQHSKAIQWAQENPNDPRSGPILRKAMEATKGAGGQLGI